MSIIKKDLQRRTLDMKYLPEITKTLLYIFIIVLSICVLFYKVPKMEFMKETVMSLEDSQNTITAFSGTTIATSVAISALPDDFATPLANTISDLNVYLIFMLIVVFAEKLIVLEGTKIALALIIPIACVLHIVYVWSSKDIFKQFARKFMILGVSIVLVIPISTHFTENVCADYMLYVDETIAETQAGADKINEVMSEDGNQSIFDKLSDALETAIQGFKDLITYFQNVVKKCVNAIAIMIVTTFVLPLLILMLFRWLLKELFALNIPAPNEQINMLAKKVKEISKRDDLISMEDDE